MEKQSEKECLLKCLSKLGDQDQEIVRLKFAAEMTNRQISKMLELSESNVGVALQGDQETERGLSGVLEWLAPKTESCSSLKTSMRCFPASNPGRRLQQIRKARLTSSSPARSRGAHAAPSPMFPSHSQAALAGKLPDGNSGRVKEEPLHSKTGSKVYSRREPGR